MSSMFFFVFSWQLTPDVRMTLDRCFDVVTTSKQRRFNLPGWERFQITQRAVSSLKKITEYIQKCNVFFIRTFNFSRGRMFIFWCQEINRPDVCLPPGIIPLVHNFLIRNLFGNFDVSNMYFGNYQGVL